MMSRARFVSSLTHLYPFYSGCGTLANHRFTKKLIGLKKETVWARVAGGEILAPLDDYVGRTAYYFGDLDPKVTWICSRLIRPGDTVMDIGANIGVVTVCMANLAGSTGHVHSFEPNPSLVKLLRQVILRNQLDNVTLHSIALGRQTGQLELRVPKANAGGASFVRNLDRPNCETVSVPVESLSAIAAQESIGSVRLIKIDVEGYEEEVFRGAHDLFRSTRPDAILFESNEHTEGPARKNPLIKILLEYDYVVLTIPRSLVRMRLNALDLNGSRLTGNDFLAVARGDQYRDIVARLNLA